MHTQRLWTQTCTSFQRLTVSGHAEVWTLLGWVLLWESLGSKFLWFWQMDLMTLRPPPRIDKSMKWVNPVKYMARWRTGSHKLSSPAATNTEQSSGSKSKCCMQPKAPGLRSHWREWLFSRSSLFCLPVLCVIMQEPAHTHSHFLISFVFEKLSFPRWSLLKTVQ